MKANKSEFFPIPHTLNPIPKHLCLLLLLFLANLAFSQPVWNGNADTTWYTDNKNLSEYTIATAEKLAGLALLVNDGYDMSGKTITLGNDIILNDTTNWQNWASEAPANSWTAIGTGSENFKGTFDGAGYSVRGVYINNSSELYQGLFGYVGSGGTVKKLGVEASYIKSGQNVGGLVGRISGGTVSNSYSKGTVSGRDQVGGLVGMNQDGTVSNSYSTVAVSVITNSVTGVTGTNLGGLVGHNYSEGNPVVTNSYYDKETSGQSDTGRGEGKSTAEMKNDTTFKNWDFIGTWNIKDGVTYPYLLNNPPIEVDSIPDQIYTGNQIKPEPHVYINRGNIPTLILGKDYTLTYGTNTNIGTGTITIKGLSEYSFFEKVISFRICTFLAENAIQTIAEQTYTGSAITPNVEVKDGSTILTKDTDYSVAFKDNINVGTATATVTGKGDYSGTLTATFTIKPKTLPSNAIQPIAAKTYTSFPITTDVVVKDGSTTLTKDTDYYDVEFTNNINAGEKAVVTVKGKGNYTGEATANFTIEKASLVISVEPEIYIGSQPTYTVDGLLGDDELISPPEFDITPDFSNPKVGDIFTVRPYNADAGDNYEITYTSGKPKVIDKEIVSDDITFEGKTFTYNGQKQSPTATYKGSSDNFTYKYTGATLGGEEYNSSEAPIDAGNYRVQAFYESKSGTGETGEVDLTIERKAIEADMFSIISPTFTGNELKPTIAAEYNGYPVTFNIGLYSNNVNAGIASVQVTGTGNYSGNLTLQFQIQRVIPTLVFPTTQPVIYNPSRTLSSVELVGGSIELGDFNWVSGSIIPTVGNEGYSVRFTPLDNVNYNWTGITLTRTVELTVLCAENDIECQSTSILPQIAIGRIKAQAINGGILLENLPQNAKVELYNLQGKQVYLGNSGNSQILKILIQTKGIYIVKAGAETFKVVK